MKAGPMSLSQNRLPQHSLSGNSAAREIEDPTDSTFLRQAHGGYDLTLRVVPLEQVVPHEHYHARR